MKKLKEIENDNTSGSMELLFKAIDLAKEIVNDGNDVEKKLFSLYQAKKEMAVFFNLVNEIYLMIEEKKSSIQIIEYLETLKKEITESSEKILLYAKDLIKDKKVFTISYSSTILHILKESKPEKIFITESRPIMEARNLAEKLDNVRFGIDYQCAEMIKNCDLVVLGADAICPAGILNKIGSLPVCIIAKYYSKPVFVFTSKMKFTPTSMELKTHPFKEVWNNEKIFIENNYFEYVPFELITHIVTEDGKISPKFDKKISNLWNLEIKI